MNEATKRNESIRVLIADDHAVVREGLRTLIDTEPGMEVVGEAEDGLEAVQQVCNLKPDVTLLDIVMPRMNGLEAIQEIKRECPDMHILVLTNFSDDEMVFPAIKAGALGYLLKNTTPERLLNAIRDVHLGKPSMSSDIAKKLILELQRTSDLPSTEESLTEREMDVLRLVAQGLSHLVRLSCPKNLPLKPGQVEAGFGAPQSDTNRLPVGIVHKLLFRSSNTYLDHYHIQD